MTTQTQTETPKVVRALEISPYRGLTVDEPCWGVVSDAQYVRGSYDPVGGTVLLQNLPARGGGRETRRVALEHVRHTLRPL